MNVSRGYCLLVSSGLVAGTSLRGPQSGCFLLFLCGSDYQIIITLLEYDVTEDLHWGDM